MTAMGTPVSGRRDPTQKATVVRDQSHRPCPLLLSPPPLLSCSSSSWLRLLLWLLGLLGTRALSNKCAQPGNSVATITGDQLGRQPSPAS